MKKNIDISRLKHVHMVGVGGIGMSAMAEILLDRGIRVSGSDLKENRLTDRLRARGCDIRAGHSVVAGTPCLVVRSFGVKDDNPEVADAKKRGIELAERSELLRALIDASGRTISVCGAHGKTTTTSMIAYAMDRAGLDPTVLIGGELDYFDGNTKTGKSDIFVTETDESDGLISTLRPGYIVITNIDKDHLEHYGTMNKLLETFAAFLRGARGDGALFYNADDPYLPKLAAHYKGKTRTFGVSENAGLRAANIEAKGLSVTFDVFAHVKKLGRCALNVPGKHNALNALAAISVLLEFGVGFNRITEILKDFRSAKRRFEIRHDSGGVMVVEDYAHHPTEIRAVIGIARGIKKNRVIAVFQPHRFTRTQYLQKEFEDAFRGADVLVLTDIYAANEKPIDGIDLKKMADAARKNGIDRVDLVFKKDIADYVRRTAESGDIVLVMGAGDVNQTIPAIIEKIAAVRHGSPV